MRLSSPGSIFILVVLSCFTSAVHAQAGKAELTGEVREQNGAIVAQSRVIVTDAATAHGSAECGSWAGFWFNHICRRSTSDSTGCQVQFLIVLK